MSLIISFLSILFPLSFSYCPILFLDPKPGDVINIPIQYLRPTQEAISWQEINRKTFGIDIIDPELEALPIDIPALDLKAPVFIAQVQSGTYFFKLDAHHKITRLKKALNNPEVSIQIEALLIDETMTDYQLADIMYKKGYLILSKPPANTWDFSQWPQHAWQLPHSPMRELTDRVIEKMGFRSKDFNNHIQIKLGARMLEQGFQKIPNDYLINDNDVERALRFILSRPILINFLLINLVIPRSQLQDHLAEFFQ